MAQCVGRADGSRHLDVVVRRNRELQSELLRALGHPVRLAILDLLRDGDLCVCEIEPELGLRQPNISQHLATLRAARLVAARREGLRVMYRVVDPDVFQILDLLPGVLHRRGGVIADSPAGNAPARAS